MAAAATSFWCALIAWGSLAAATWTSRPGDAVPAPVRWPSASAIARSTTGPTLLVFAHPRCPCTAATLRELERIAARCAPRLDVEVLFHLPAGAPDGWRDGASWRLAAAIPGVGVRADPEGREARRFGARTSGGALLFDAHGRLLFEGGLTGARGHEGDNAGKSAVLAHVLAGGSDTRATPVFGCPLFDDAPTARAARPTESLP